ncbi:hypothetical protein AVEN_215573-1 [Araneus ventricosus]|uniref:Uncharacterized protein n=1 Tax=Araneus ventricosus TaxID=182803 RepID=A0A4Y2P886_ARAVE|nr:hypothetical protein AVEN_215573-1 [Araneus ventricosus]
MTLASEGDPSQSTHPAMSRHGLSIVSPTGPDITWNHLDKYGLIEISRKNSSSFEIPHFVSKWPNACPSAAKTSPRSEVKCLHCPRHSILLPCERSSQP